MSQIKLTRSAHGEHMMCTRVYTLVQTSLYCTIGTNVTNQSEVCLGVYTVLGETTRNPTNTMVKPLDSNVQLQL